MNPARTLLAALHAEPGDDTAWLALADSLEEQGQLPQADLLRLLRSLRPTAGEVGSPERRAGEARLRQLLADGGDPVLPERVNSVGMRLGLIPAGLFWMGAPEEARQGRGDERPRHKVEISRPFYLGLHQVTQDQYEKVVGTNPSKFGRAKHQGVAREAAAFPVESVSWEDAVEFCSRLSGLPEEKEAGRVYRLPSEAEWEYACRAWSLGYTDFHFGDSLCATQANFDGNHPAGEAPRGPYLKRTTPVGSYRPNAFGLFDMHGNLWEWVADGYAADYYGRSPERDPPGPADFDYRVLRGGSWDCIGTYCRTAHRLDQAATSRDHGFGFRVACAWPCR